MTITSRSAVGARIKKLWDCSYPVRLRDYLSRMDDILDRREELGRLRTSLARKKDLAKDRPRKLAALRQKEKRLNLLEKRIVDDEKKISDACRLREKYRPPEAPKKDS